MPKLRTEFTVYRPPLSKEEIAQRRADGQRFLLDGCADGGIWHRAFPEWMIPSRFERRAEYPINVISEAQAMYLQSSVFSI